MTFTTDELGEAQATFLLVCSDDRGALSDTVVQFIPLRNFPPLIGLQSVFDPLKNMQREFIDADGNAHRGRGGRGRHGLLELGRHELPICRPSIRTAAAPWITFYRYTLADDLPDSTYDLGDPRANPETAWVRAPFMDDADFAFFDILFEDVQPGTRTLTVSVKDEAGSDPMFRYQWVVRPPRGPVLYIPDVSSSATRRFYLEYLDSSFGAGGWDRFNFWIGFPDDPRRPAVYLPQVRPGPVDGHGHRLEQSQVGGVERGRADPLGGSGRWSRTGTTHVRLAGPDRNEDRAGPPLPPGRDGGQPHRITAQPVADAAGQAGREPGRLPAPGDLDAQLERRGHRTQYPGRGGQRGPVPYGGVPGMLRGSAPARAPLRSHRGGARALAGHPCRGLAGGHQPAAGRVREDGGLRPSRRHSFARDWG